MKVTLNLDVHDAQAGILALKTRFPFAMRRAVRKAAISGRAEMAKAIVADTGLPSKRVKEEIRINEVGEFGAQLEVTGRRLPLIDFRARAPEPSRGRGRGVSYRLPGGRGRAEHAFIATMRSGHRGVFQRSGEARTPIYELHGPSLVRVFEKFLPLGADRAREALLTNVRSEINFVLSRR